MPSIRDVAERAGVSITAVSRALNDYPDINADTKARILRVVEEMRYYPKASARSLVMNKSNIIGVYYPTRDGIGFQQPFIGTMLDIFKDEIGKLGYDLMILGNSTAPFDSFSLFERVKHREVDGVVLLGKTDETIKQLAESNVPLVGIDHFVTGPRCGSVTSENRRAVHDAVERLVRGGYQRIAFAHGPLDLPVAVERLQGFYSGMAAMGRAVERAWVVDGSFSLEGGVASAKALLACASMPDVVLCAADITAIGIMQEFFRSGISIPDDVSLVGFDDIAAASYVYPPLTTIRQDVNGLGKRAAQMMVDLIEGGSDAFPMHYVLPTEFIVRNSTRNM
ncbi:LacI family DNA-binding transcriptional regulator [Ferroacidibacillus organovorans]|uniref:LacI family transcriptional regulator n=1 Tax=Ferroacidibacillus organovorans TaxID=1765683 RepID=A0A162UPE6_9BACL|nr:LacI family DNA-binding transcriptional regulator [Ferroacidibacillus organovorans]KYP81929.1 hypothetical protein AYJ22_05245 [Ferroacidibacillus organovorans]OAG94904.1 hypothetical protein AYW79_02600 [Ferroacidibacillus organovorans]OPG15018.1 LacI family transcriptional regulator [Ferroacidibacillus organovorans]